jgi:hypothetical protein
MTNGKQGYLVNKISDNMQHIPFVPWLRFLVPMISISPGKSITVSVFGFFQSVPNYESVERSIAQRIGFVD